MFLIALSLLGDWVCERNDTILANLDKIIDKLDELFDEFSKT